MLTVRSGACFFIIKRQKKRDKKYVAPSTNVNNTLDFNNTAIVWKPSPAADLLLIELDPGRVPAFEPIIDQGASLTIARFASFWVSKQSAVSWDLSSTGTPRPRPRSNPASTLEPDPGRHSARHLTPSPARTTTSSRRANAGASQPSIYLSLATGALPCLPGWCRVFPEWERMTATRFPGEPGSQRGLFPPRCFQYFLCDLVIVPQLSGRTTVAGGLSSGSSSWSLSPVSAGCVFAASGESVGKVSCGTRCPVARVATCCAVSVVGSGKSSVVSMGPGAVARACLGDAGSASGPGQSSFIPMVSVMVGSAGAAVPLARNRWRRLVSGSSVLRRQDRAFWGLFFSFGVVRVVCFVPGRGHRLGSYSRGVEELVDSRGVVVSH